MSELELITMPHQIKALTDNEPLILSDVPVSHFGCHRYRLVVDEADVDKYKTLSAGRLEYKLVDTPSDLDMRHLKDIISAWIHMKTGITIDRLIKEDNILIPAHNGEFLYMMKYQARQLAFDFDQCVGYGLLSGSLLAPHELPGAKSIDIRSIKQVDDLILYKLDATISETEVVSFDGQVHTKWATGHAAITQSPQFATKLWLTRELARVWGFNVETDELTIGSRKSQVISDTSPGCALKAWLEDSLLRILDNQPLIVIKHYSWLQELSDDEVNYVVAAAYRRVQENNPLLVDAKPELMIGFGLRLPVYDPEDVLRFATYATKYVARLPERKTLVQTNPRRRLILKGQISYDDGTWFVQINDVSRPIIRDQVSNPNDQEVLRSKLQNAWWLGKLVTNWGYHLYTKYNRVSIHLVNPVGM